MTSLDHALAQFDAAEANLRKLEELWGRIRKLLPDGPAFGAPAGYDEACLAFRNILPHCPAIGGVRITDALHGFDELGQWHLDVLQIDEPEAHVTLMQAREEQGVALRQYRFHLQQKRRELVRARVRELLDTIDPIVRSIPASIRGKESADSMPGVLRSGMLQAADELEGLFGTSSRPPRWSDFRRHLSFGQVQDARDIYEADWPAIRDHLLASAYGEHDPLPVAVTDLADVVASQPSGPLSRKLLWDKLDAEAFERLLYLLISGTPGYENPEWLQQTNAPDRGRDLSVTQVVSDPLKPQMLLGRTFAPRSRVATICYHASLLSADRRPACRLVKPETTRCHLRLETR